MPGNILQIVVALILIIVFFIIGFSIYNMENIKAMQDSNKVKVITSIFDGIKDFNTVNNEAYNTMNSNSSSYRNLGASANQYAGTEMTYNFWLYIDNSKNQVFIPIQDSTNTTTISADPGLLNSDGTSAFNSKDLPFILFLRGNPIPYVYKNLCSDKNNDNNSTILKTDILVKCPLVKLEHGGDVLTVEFNTLINPDALKFDSRNICNDKNTSWQYMNSYKVGLQGLNSRQTLQKKWFMVTVIIQDTFPTDPYPIRNKIRTRIYINGVRELDKYITGSISFNGVEEINNTIQTYNVSNPIKSNQGNLYVAPNIMYNTQNGSVIQTTMGKVTVPKALMMSDLKYANYSLSDGEIKSMYSNGITKHYAPNQNTSGNLPDANAFMSQLSIDQSTNMLSEIQ